MVSVPSVVRDKIAWLDLKELDDRGEGLTQWEVDFVESLTLWLLKGGILTEPQRSKLNSIREERL